MTRTDPPDIIVSTLYQDITIGPNCGPTKYSVSTKECDSQMVGTLNQNFEITNKRHCRSFDFIELLDDPNTCSSMDHPYTTDQQTVNKDVMWNGIGQPGHLRFSSPDLFNTRLSQQMTNTDKTSETIRTTVQGKTKSVPKVRATLTPVPITVSQLSTNRGISPVDPQKRLDRLPQTRETSFNTNRALVNEVHPIKLQPHTPLYVSDFEGKNQDKATNTPHVRCRVDIKPDASVLQHTTRKMRTASGDASWQHNSTSSFRSLSVPRQTSSRTSTPKDPCRYPGQPSRTYYQDDQYSINSGNSQNPSISGQHVYDPRSRWVHTMPTRTYYTDPQQESLDGYYNRPYPQCEPEPYFMPSQARTYCGEGARSYGFPSDPSKIFYTQTCRSPTEQTIPMRAYNTEGRKPPRISQAFSDDWHRSSIATYSSQYPSLQATPQRVPTLIPWYPNEFTEPTRLGGDVRNFSKSWDNILIPQTEKEHAVSRGRSYENLYHQRGGAFHDNRQKPVIINLSSSPRRYAALSLSENSLDKYASDGKMGVGQHWFVTPEITITDNDIRAGNRRNKDASSVTWDVENGRRVQNENAHNLAGPSDPQERKLNNSTLKQSLEQLDELLADLVIDYIPQNSRQSNEDLIDQLKQLINDDEMKGEQILDQEDSGLLNTQTDSSKTSPDTIKDPDSGCEGFNRTAEGMSLNNTPNDDDAMVCSNSRCHHRESLFNASLYFKSCHSCHTYYCSRNCRWEDWDTHKKTCMNSRISSVCRHVLKNCRENSEVHKAFSRIAKVGFLSRGRGVLFIGFPNPGSADNFLQVGLESLLMSPIYLSLRELDNFKDNLGEYCKELQDAGKQYDPSECFLLNVSIAIGELMSKRPSPKLQAPTVRKYAKISLASSSPDKMVLKKESDMETLILTPPPGTSDINKEGQEGRKAREVCFINIQKELRTRGVFLRHEFPQIYNQLCEFVENNKRFTPTTIYPIDKRTGKQFMCMIMAASEPRTLDWIGAPHLLDDII
ncbi:apical junction component 1 homolog isoform X2 [Brachyhypopomus gauderio]|uniref:apical junction component 1 homolog isoform X2 n=1 Tax=Brachyhypopomus gauderio TaxID=698409 RepID=UPI004041338A